MAVYVDNAKHPFGRLLMCHMWADTRAELFAMADRIGIQRKWFQRPAGLGVAGMDASWEHFDIAQSKRTLAVAAGAIETEKYGPVEHTARLKGDLEQIERIARLRANGFGAAAVAASPNQGRLL
ncbi:MAG: DUF4031 domain-containing protein [Mesorhizobium sp.]|uniref:DUF4031 domain-containing protein n=1 Tax=Mesorhizobium sp. TaxID=1871066 RepID=UPI000FE69B6B|nr:DUF4031 domain-containing protein [Mesorhizobium sp.]RWC29813.1 MAG: DUF4031 domain-containing protein [Mesorhizobium sp.]